MIDLEEMITEYIDKEIEYRENREKVCATSKQDLYELDYLKSIDNDDLGVLIDKIQNDEKLQEKIYETINWYLWGNDLN